MTYVTSSNTLIELKNISVQYEHQQHRIVAVDAVDLTLAKGELGVLIGPSGCGKSTLLHILAGLHSNYDGQMLHPYGTTDKLTKHTALILQDYGLFPWKTVTENVALGLKIRNVAKYEITQTVRQILQQLNIEHLANRFPKELSGGQRQRVAIARALALKPDLLLMDEPFSALDALTREELQDLVLSIWKQTKMTVLLVTHNIEEAAFLGQNIYVMSPSPGQIVNKVENPIAGDDTARNNPEFYELCNRLRSFLKKENVK